MLRHLLDGIQSEEVVRLRAENGNAKAKLAQQRAAAKGVVGRSPYAVLATEGDADADGSADEADAPASGMGPDPPTLVDRIFSGELRSTIVRCRATHAPSAPAPPRARGRARCTPP